jgi:flagellar hook assembly protein FlgD
VTDPLGNVVATGAGSGKAVDWSWDARAATPGVYTYAIEAPGARSATGTVGAPLTVANVSVSPGLVSPNGDGRNDTVLVAYRLRRSAPVSASVIDANGTTVATLFAGTRTAGRHSFHWDGSGLPDARYRVVVAARDAKAAAAVLLDRTLAAFAATPPAFSPNGDGRSDSTVLSFMLAAPAQVQVRVLQSGRPVVSLAKAPLAAGPQSYAWDGTVGGKRVADGTYEAVVSAKDSLTTLNQSVNVVIDTKPPTLRLDSLAKLSFWVSEAAIVTADIDGRRVVRAAKRGSFTLAHTGPVHTVTASARDAAGNLSATLRRP